MPDDTTFIWNIRKGVYYENKAPVNGRQLDAYDVEWNYHRMLGLGDFSEDGPSARMYDIAQGIEIQHLVGSWGKKRHPLSVFALFLFVDALV